MSVKASGGSVEVNTTGAREQSDVTHPLDRSYSASINSTLAAVSVAIILLIAHSHQALICRGPGNHP